ncbi:hypothetical protein [Lacimicrobium sp. SS2-24]|uniref:hypothetical protein n=1 Tax=Lacimicrobium sp. SS2-24 TaxID=2005569 RepID=UPI0011309992|nr:hypothetical protein [Lacimicrobium sp. SS2-24]
MPACLLSASFFLSLRWLVLLLFFAPFSANATPPNLLIGHIRHPHMEPIKSLLKEAYAQLNIDVSFLETPMERERLLAANGTIDGIAVRFGAMAEELKGVVMVDAPIMRIRVHLICRLHIPCHASMLNDPKNSIAVPFGASIVTRLLSTYQAKPIFLSYNQQVINMIKDGKIDYGFTAVDPDSSHTLVGIQIAEPPVYDDLAYHFISERYAWLAPSLANAILQAKQATPLTSPE